MMWAVKYSTGTDSRMVTVAKGVQILPRTVAGEFGNILSIGKLSSRIARKELVVGVI